jgi:sugar lactone lactonase YvrE
MGPRVVLEGLGFPESTRWHGGRLWLCNWGAGEVLAVSPEGDAEVHARVAARTLPFSIDWLPDRRLLLVDGPRRVVLAGQPDGSLEVFADLSALGEGPLNELVVDDTGHVYVNGGEGRIALIKPDGTAREVADGLRFPNGMALLDTSRTLIVADSHTHELLAYDRSADGVLGPARVWAKLDHTPDGICTDAEGAVWVATVPGRRCMRVREGGEVLDTVRIDRGCFACMLGGDDGRTLFIAAASWRGMEAARTQGPGLTGQLLAAPGQPAAHAGRP